MGSKLALFGGKPIREKPFPPYISIGEEEKKAVMEVLDTGILSNFYGSSDPRFYGGDRVQKVEREWEEYFGVKYAITVNSATSGLYTAVGAVGVEPGDEVILPPSTMSATASAVLVYGAIPVFVDVQDDIFCIDPKKIKEAITSRTKAIMVVHLWGHPARMDEIMEIARKRNLVVIEDNAQAPGGTYKGKYNGTIGDIGIFSLNCHKTIQSGEGGVIVTNDENFAMRSQLIRNHGENVVEDMGIKNLSNMIGWNYRMTEMEAAVASEQLKKLDSLNEARIELADYLTEHLSGIDGLTPPVVLPGCKHVYYTYSMKFNEEKTGISRNSFLKALSAEGIPFVPGSQPLYMLPMFQKKICFGSNGYPFKSPYYTGNVSYEKGICPVAERLADKEFFLSEICRPPCTKKDMDDIINAIQKVLECKDELR